MIYYPLEVMRKSGIKEVLLTSSADHAGHFANLLGSGEEFGLRLYYAVQKNPKGGIAEALALAEEFTRNGPLLVLLGDNVFNFNLTKSIAKFEKQKEGAVIFGVHADTKSKQYGVIETDSSGKVLSIIEKPDNPKSDIAQTGIYIYDSRVFEYIRSLTPSGRGELEVTDLNNIYLRNGQLTCEIIDWWIDAGSSFDELLEANNRVAGMVREGKL
jgi:glucose-1-phosphate thymidylyltransferase